MLATLEEEEEFFSLYLESIYNNISKKKKNYQIQSLELYFATRSSISWLNLRREKKKLWV
ncbi:hypothetical protein BVRB_9g221800 [Beta vulgaris subsp. vulgaris]|nr:hypothetical protein BVRB_9g221800 [Beta vulgaris subsp. vulgaris]